MRMSSPCSRRAAAGALCLTIAFLGGCASKNPLIDESAAPAAGTPTTGDGVAMSGPTGLRRIFGSLAPYRVDVQQGNFVSREMVAQLKEGMRTKDGVTREQVRFVLGTPLLTDIFHADRWDYAFRLKKGSGEVISSRVTVFFKDNRLVSIDGGMLPTEQEYLALIAGAAPAKSNK